MINFFNILKLIILVAISIIVLFLVANFVWSKIENWQNPPVGKMVDVGGVKLHCIDSGETNENKDKPVVIIETGCGCNCLWWQAMHNEIAQFARVISYDRAGLGFSEPANSQRTNSIIAQELNSLLSSIKINKPIIIVGASLGGVFARFFANEYPKRVAGLVLVDPATEFFDLKSFSNVMEAHFKKARIKKWKVLFGLHRLFGQSMSMVAMMQKFGMMPSFFDQKIVKLLKLKEFSVNEINASLQEAQSTDLFINELRTSNNEMQKKPLTIITASKNMHGMDDYWNQWRKAQLPLLSLSSKSKQVFAEKSNHNVILSEPELIVTAIKEMIDVN